MLMCKPWQSYTQTQHAMNTRDQTQWYPTEQNMQQICAYPAVILYRSETYNLAMEQNQTLLR